MVTGAPSVFYVKLLRDVWRLRSQSLAISLVVAAGVGMVIMSFGLIRSLEATRSAYYEAYRFADVFAPVRRAPQSVMQDVARITGIAAAESRISTTAILDVPSVAEPVTARIHSLPSSGQPALNRLLLRSGRLPDPSRAGEAVASEAFVKAARLELGDQVPALIRGHQVKLTLVGVVISPEYVYAVAPGGIFPDNRRYGVLWMGREPLAAALDLTGAFNEIVATLSPGAEPQDVLRRLDALLEPYGAPGAYTRHEQASDRFVSNEIDQLAATIEVLPPIFLGVAAFLLNIVLARVVDAEREVIGLLKAFGYRDGAIMLHYAQLAILLCLGGLLLGGLIGVWLGRAAAGLYQAYFTFPFLEFRAGADAFLVAFGATLTAVLAGALSAVWRAARLTPAEAMRPPAPRDYSSSAVAGTPVLRLDEPTRMILRGLVRRPVRSGLTVLGIACALALYTASASMDDSVDSMIDIAFGQAQRSDVTVTFAEALDARALYELQHMPGVTRVEPFRFADARLKAGPREEREALSGGESGGDLSRLVDLDGHVLEPPARGALVSSRLARILSIKPGDTITAEITEGERLKFAIEVVAVTDTPIGGSVVLDRAVLNRLLREGDSLSGAHLRVDGAQSSALYATLKKTPNLVSVTVREATLQGIEDTIAESIGLLNLFNVGFAVLIVFGVVYNSGRISLAERARDLASLRVLGFRRREVAYVLLGELALLVLLALPIGLLLGVGLSRFLIERFSGELYSLPATVSAQTLSQGVLVVGGAAAITALFLRDRLDRLDLIRALKTRE